MSRGLNKVMLIGNLGRDPEMKYTQQGTPVTTFSMAVTRSWKTPDGQLSDETEWFRIVAWERLAEQCNEFLRKGSKVYIEGRLKTREWQDQQGQNRQTVEVIASSMVLLDSRQQAGQGAPAGAGAGYGAPPERSGSSGQSPRSGQAPAGRGGGGGAAPSGGNGYDDADMDVDDIPF